MFASAPFAMKQAALGAGVAARRNGAPLSLAAVVFALFVFATFLYNEDIKSIADFPFGAGALRAKSPDLHVLQETVGAAHLAAGSIAKRGEEVIVRVLDAPASTAMAAAAGSSSNNSTIEVAKANANANANAADAGVKVDEGQERERDVTLPSVKEGGADEARRREDEEAAEKESSAKAAAATAALRTVVSVPDTCDLYRGNWVYDEVNAPVYKESQCEFLTEQVTCMRNGRRDDSYQKWRWQPTDCDLPRYAISSPTIFSRHFLPNFVPFHAIPGNRH